MMGAWPSLLAFILKPGLPGSHTSHTMWPEFSECQSGLPFPLRNSESGDFCLSLTHAPPLVLRTVSSRAAVLNLPSDWVVDGFSGLASISCG